MNKTNKFGEFYSQSHSRQISASCLNEYNYIQYKNDMFCPYCHQAKLSFVLHTTNKKRHLKTAPKSLHTSNCLYKNEQKSHKTTTEYVKTLTSKQIKNQLKSALRYLSEKQDDNAIVPPQDNNKKATIDMQTKIRVSKSHQTLRKKSLKELEFKRSKNDDLFLFFGKTVKLDFRQTQENGKYLNIATQNNKGQNIRIGIIVSKQYYVDKNALYNIVIIGYITCTINKNGGEQFNIIPFDKDCECVSYETIKTK
ncbi:hypothetical protein [Helicobacter sp. T3_23-1056]